jgi:uncharacterized protein (DUF736 family)
VLRGYDSVRFRIAARKLPRLEEDRTGADREYLSVKLDDPSFAVTIWRYGQG